jgi:hypothetical protein
MGAGRRGVEDRDRDGEKGREHGLSSAIIKWGKRACSADASEPGAHARQMALAAAALGIRAIQRRDRTSTTHIRP